MKRYIELDILKGFAVICMVIFHIYYFPNQYGYKEIEYDTPLLKTVAKIAQIIFITCVGINLVLSKQKHGSININRIVKLIFLAACMSIFTYFVFDDKYVKFGILHFIAVVSIFFVPFIDDIRKIHFISLLLVVLFLLMKKSPELFLKVKQPLAFIMGFYNDRYHSIDHFSIIPWIFVVLFGIYIGHYLINSNYTSSVDISEYPFINTLSKTGEYSLEVYVLHWVILYIYYVYIYK